MPKALWVESAYFEKALSPSFRDGQTNTIYFPRDTKEPWRLFLYFLFHKRIEADKTGTRQNAVIRLRVLIDAFLFGDRYGLARFQNQVIRNFLTTLSQAELKCDELKQFIDLVPPESSLYRLLIAEIVHCVQNTSACWSDFGGFTKQDSVNIQLLKEYQRWCDFMKKGAGMNRTRGWSIEDIDTYLVKE